MKSYQPIHLPKQEGQTGRTAHANLPSGSYEREIGREGFFGQATHMYHRNPPTGWIHWEGPLKPRALDCQKLPADTSMDPCPFEAQVLFSNSDTEIRFWKLQEKMSHLARNADGDWMLFIHEGSGELFCDYGHISLVAGDYLLMPRSTMWRLEPTAPMAILMIQATDGQYALPEKGLLGPQAIFDPAILDSPCINDRFSAQSLEAGQWQVKIKKDQAISTVTFPYNPLDAIGWHGELMPVRLNVKDIRPIMSHRYHLPPSVHTTFVANGFVICTFVPRPFETDPDALKIPFFHNNDDFDELIFYHAGDFFSRDHIEPGMMTFHPSGFTHGPHPKALQNMLKQSKPATDEYAVMIDTRKSLKPGDLQGIEDLTYIDSWQTQGTSKTAVEPAMAD